MSKTVDQRVVEMQFDNKNFEKNVSTTMSTLDEFKQKLHLDGASKGLDTVGSSVDTLKMKFSALDVVGVTALTNITNSVVNAGKRFIESLTIDPIRDGFNEYEMTLNAVQTTMAGTGKTAEQVQEQLKLLDKYADDTVYSSADMFSNLPKFTNAGVELEDATTAMIGIANATALAGGDANKASIAFYNLGQSISTGYLSRMDYNSINNAGIATMEWKKHMIEAALAAGTLTKAGDDLYQAGNKEYTLQSLFIDGLQEQWATTDVMMKVFKDYGNTETEIGNKAQHAAQDLRTFSQMMESLKAQAGTGWKDTWQLIFGDLDEATKLWTKVGSEIGNAISVVSNARNSLIKGVLGQSSKWDEFEKKVNDAGVSTEDFSKKLEGVAKEHGIAIDDMIAEQGSLINVIKSGKIPREVFVDTLKEFANAEAGTSEATEDMTDKLEYFQNVVNDIWRGDFQNGEERIQALTDAGYEYSKVQDLVNKTVDGHKLTLEELSDVQLESVGYTEEQISALRQLAEEAEQSGSSIDKMLEQMNRPSGRELIFGENGILSNQLYNLKAAIDSIGKAFSSVFKKDDAVEGAYGFLKALQEITYKLRMSDETAKNLEKTFKGVFTVFKLLSSILNAGIMIPFKILNGVLGSFNLHILDVTGGVGELVYQFGQWIQKCGLLNKGINFAVSGIVKLINWVGKGYNKLTSIPIVSNNLNNLKSTIKDLFENSDKYFNAGKDTVLGWIDAFNKLPVISGAVSGVKGAFNDLIQLIKDIVNSSKNWTSFGDALKDISDRIFPKFQSASRATAKSGRVVAENISIAANETEPAASKLSGAVSGVYETMKKFVDFVGNKLANLNLGKILATAFGAIFIVAAVKTFTLVSSFSKLLDGVAGLLGSATGVVNNFGKALGNISKASKNVAKSMKFKAIGEMVWDMAKSFALIAGALVVLSKVDGAGLRNALIALGLVIGAMAGLTIVMSKFPVKDTTLSAGIIMALSVAVVILAKAVKILSGIDFWSAVGAIGAVTILLTELVAACVILGKFGGTMTKGAGTLLILSTSMVIMSLAVSNLAKLDPEAATNAVLLLGQLMLKMGETLFIIGLVGKSAKSGATGILLLTLSMGLMVLLVKVVSKFTVKEVVTAGIIMAAMIAMIYVMSKCIKQLGNAGQYAAKAGRAIFLISAAMLLMAVSVKIFSSMSLADIAKGSIAILGFTLMCGLLIQFVRKTGNNAGKAAAVILAFGAAMMALSVSLFILSSLDPAGIAIGTAAISAITLMMMLLVKSTRYATDVSKSIVAIAICIGVIAGSIALLSMLNPAKAALGTGAIAVILGMVTVLVKSTKGVHPDMYKNLLAITGIIAAIGLIIGILAMLPIDKTIGIAASLSMMLLSIAASMKIISSVRAITTSALIGLAAMTLVMAALGVILALVTHFADADKALLIAASLSLLILSLSASCILLAIAGTAGPAALVGVAALVDLMTGLSVLIGAIAVVMTVVGALVTKFPMLETFLDTGLSLLGKIGKGIGEFFGNIVAGFVDGASKGLIDFADNLSGFMEHLQPFLDSANGIDPSVVNSIKSLAEAILILTAANLLDSIGSFIGLDADWSQLGNKLVSFGQAITDFSNTLNDGNISAEKVESAANAGKMIAELQDSLPRTGGWWQSIAGEKDLETFGNQMVAFGTAIINFSNELDKGTINSDNVEAAANAGNLMAELEKALPKSDGWWQSVAGEQDISTFGTKVEAFGESIAKFAGSISGGIEQSDIEAAANAGNLMAELEKALPKSDGWWQSVAGEQDISSFGTKIESFGESLRLFGQKVNNIGYTNVNRAIESSNNLISLMKDASSINADAVGGFTGGLAALGRASVDGFISAFSERDGEAISEATSFVNKVAEGIQNGRPNTRAAMDDVLKELITIIGEWNTDFKSAADSITSGLKAGIEDGRQNTRSAIDDVLSEIVTICGEWQTDMYNAGSYLVQGFANGIDENTWRSEATVRAMAKNAYDTAMNEIDAASPSKLFKKVGSYIPAGFAIGIASLGSKIKQSTRSMSQNAIDVMSESMSSVNHLLNSDMNVQPTIRPVLDLSSVQSGASNIGTLLNGNYRVGAMASSIATSQNSRVTVTNSDVVGAINQLRKDINEMPQGDTYRIDGITYDDGSNISSAVETLIRAATVGRRV